MRQGKGRPAIEQNNRKLGGYYEKLAAVFLEEKGYHILAKNYRCPQGEVDVIARSPEGVYVFVEVKYRRTKRYGDAFSAVGEAKQARISRAALWYMSARHMPMTSPVRFDVIGINGDEEIRHIENAFPYRAGSIQRRR